MTHLEAINRLLGFIGTRAVPVVVGSQHPEVLKAVSMLNTSMERLLKRGWWFNKVYNVDYVPQSTGEILLPKNVLSIEPAKTVLQHNMLTMRGQKLFDAQNNTYLFGTPVTLTVNQQLDWEDIPMSAQDFMVYEAGVELVRDVLNDQMKVRQLEQALGRAWADLRTEEINTEQVNVFSASRVRSTRNLRGKPHILARH